MLGSWSCLYRYQQYDENNHCVFLEDPRRRIAEPLLLHQAVDVVREDIDSGDAARCAEDSYSYGRSAEYSAMSSSRHEQFKSRGHEQLKSRAHGADVEACDSSEGKEDSLRALEEKYERNMQRLEVSRAPPHARAVLH